MLKTNRKIRISPKEEFKGLLWFYVGILVAIFITLFLSIDNKEFHEFQGKITYLFFVIFIYRLFTFKDWAEHYKETINFLLFSQKLDAYIASSLLNVLSDIIILAIFFFWIEIDKISIARIPAAGLVYLIMIGLSFLFKRKR